MSGDPAEPISLQEHLLEHPGDDLARLRYADQLITGGEREAARAILAPIALPGHPRQREAIARLATVDEQDGRPGEAAARWERVLADEIDDDQAWAQLGRLRPPSDAAPPAPAGGLLATTPTLDSASGVTVSRFEILREIGRGGSATVYLARDTRLDLELALKVLHPRATGAPGADAHHRFFHEARTVAGLRHPGVVAIYDVDEPARTLVMEHVAGGTLRERLRPRAGTAAPRLGPGEVRALARRMLEALAYVHGAGVVHGDLTPRNVLLRTPTEPVLVDFGIARVPEAPGEVPEPAAGTPLYLAPEQFRGAASSERTDLFAVGAVLWEALAGRPMRAHADLVRERPLSRPLPADVTAALGAEHQALTELVARLTASVPDERPPTARAALGLLAR